MTLAVESQERVALRSCGMEDALVLLFGHEAALPCLDAYVISLKVLPSPAMVRTSQTAGGCSSTATYNQHFEDDKYDSAVSVTTCAVQPEKIPSPPTDNTNNPIFSFEVYASIELHLNVERPALKPSRPDESLFQIQCLRAWPT